MFRKLIYMQRVVPNYATYRHTPAMNLRTLEQFLLLCETLNFGRASSHANISTSALSRNIRQLEAALKTPLFNRDNRSVELTPEGHKFQRYARNAVLQWQQICHELTDPSEQLQGEISLYCSVTASHSILFDLLNRFRPAQPGIDIKLQTGDPEHAVSRVLALEEELSIAARPASLPRGVIFKPILVSPLVFIAPVESTDPNLVQLPPEKVITWQQIPMILATGGIATITAAQREVLATPPAARPERG